MNQDITLEYMHLCDYASPAINSKINLLGIFDSFIKSAEVKLFDFYIAAKINVKEKSKYQVSFEVISTKNNKKIFADPNPIQIPKNAPTLNYNIIKQIKGFNFPDFGEYEFKILVNDTIVGEKKVEVKSVWPTNQ